MRSLLNSVLLLLVNLIPIPEMLHYMSHLQGNDLLVFLVAVCMVDKKYLSGTRKEILAGLNCGIVRWK